jgi:hypothetical protein
MGKSAAKPREGALAQGEFYVGGYLGAAFTPIMGGWATLASIHYEMVHPS